MGKSQVPRSQKPWLWGTGSSPRSTLPGQLLDKDTEGIFPLSFHQSLWGSLELVWLPTGRPFLYIACLTGSWETTATKGKIPSGVSTCNQAQWGRDSVSAKSTKHAKMRDQERGLLPAGGHGKNAHFSGMAHSWGKIRSLGSLHIFMWRGHLGMGTFLSMPSVHKKSVQEEEKNHRSP